MTAIKLLSWNKSFGGVTARYEHASAVLGCNMTFSVLAPPSVASSLPLLPPAFTTTTTTAAAAATTTTKAPTLLFLSGLTCTDRNFVEKAGAQRSIEHTNLVIVCADTSPRGVKIEGDSDSWDFGVAASFYLNAVTDKWSAHYRMEDYIAQELPKVLASNFDVLDLARLGVCGHSMGGHGALTLAFKHPHLFRSVSAFAPICNPSQCPWGIKAFSGYLGDSQQARDTLWKKHDAVELAKVYSGPARDILVDVGDADDFLAKGQLLPERFVEAAKTNSTNVALTMRMQPGYDHSYFFIASFIDDHVRHHLKHLLLLQQQ